MGTMGIPNSLVVITGKVCSDFFVFIKDSAPLWEIHRECFPNILVFSKGLPSDEHTGESLLTDGEYSEQNQILGGEFTYKPLRNTNDSTNIHQYWKSFKNLVTLRL
jgi:hypothetical protein